MTEIKIICRNVENPYKSKDDEKHFSDRNSSKLISTSAHTHWLNFDNDKAKISGSLHSNLINVKNY